MEQRSGCSGRLTAGGHHPQGFLGTRPQTTPDHLGRTTPSPHAATPSRPAWANPRQEPIQEVRPAFRILQGRTCCPSRPGSLPLSRPHFDRHLSA